MWEHPHTQPRPNRWIGRDPKALSCADPPSGVPGILAAELSCPANDTNDCAVTGADCVLAFQIDPGDAPLNPRIELRIVNAFHQVVYRENRLLDLLGADNRQPIEVHWRFVCPLGTGLYRCSLAFGMVKLQDVYEFTVVQPPQSPWSSLVNLRPTVAVIEPPDTSAEGLAGSIATTADTPSAAPGALLFLPATIRNEGTVAWRAEGITRVVVGYKVFNEPGVCVVEDGLHTVLPHRMAPGDTAAIALRIEGARGTWPLPSHRSSCASGWLGSARHLRCL